MTELRGHPPAERRPPRRGDVGEWVNFEAVVTKLGKTSIKVHVQAYAEGRHDDRRLACVAEFTMVAVKQQVDGLYTKCTHNQMLK